jgi:hypothetical protein
MGASAGGRSALDILGRVETVMKRLLIAGVALGAVFGVYQGAMADPVDDTLEIDGTPIITRAAAPEGHPV